jgi:hypothetical protein
VSSDKFGMIAVGAAVALVPWIVAVIRGHRNAAPILVLCVASGLVALAAASYRWEEAVAVLPGVGWVAALVWSMLADQAPQRYGRGRQRGGNPWGD